MVYAMLFAGGTGTRMKSSDIPKQFIEVDGKPIIIKTMENFAQHDGVDHIVVACLESWIDHLLMLIQKYQIPKVLAVVPGGDSGYQTIHNGIVKIGETAEPEDLLLICDAVRPIISQELITNCINKARKYETAVPVVPSIDSVLYSEDGRMCGKSMPRSCMYITQAPQGYTFRKIMWAHDEAERRGITNPTSSSELLIELGEEVRLFIGDRDNIKVTTPEDLDQLRSHYYYQRYKQFAREELKYGF